VNAQERRVGRCFRMRRALRIRSISDLGRTISAVCLEAGSGGFDFNPDRLGQEWPSLKTHHLLIVRINLLLTHSHLAQSSFTYPPFANCVSTKLKGSELPVSTSPDFSDRSTTIGHGPVRG
jgi:hypothetical protein